MVSPINRYIKEMQASQNSVTEPHLPIRVKYESKRTNGKVFQLFNNLKINF